MLYDKTNPLFVRKLIKELVPGDILVHPIYRADGLMLINKNKVLDISLIEKIMKHVLPSASVLVSPLSGEPEGLSSDSNAIANQCANDWLKEINDSFDSNTIEANARYDNTLVGTLSSSPYWKALECYLESEYLKERANSIKNELLDLFKTDQTIISLFLKISRYNDILMIHSINTVCISLVIGITLELSNADLLDLSVAALFLNIGFTELPMEEFKSYLKSQKYHHPAMKKHLEIFSSMTLNSPILRKKSIIHGILDHHENYNGEGFPNGKRGEEISLFGRILHIAHAYDTLVGGYNYTSGVTPIYGFKNVYENKETVFDADILKVFLYRTTYFKVGEILSFPNGATGKIIGFENYLKSPHLPIIQLENGRKVNLLKEDFVG